MPLVSTPFGSVMQREIDDLKYYYPIVELAVGQVFIGLNYICTKIISPGQAENRLKPS